MEIDYGIAHYADWTVTKTVKETVLIIVSMEMDYGIAYYADWTVTKTVAETVLIITSFEIDHGIVLGAGWTVTKTANNKDCFNYGFCGGRLRYRSLC